MHVIGLLFPPVVNLLSSPGEGIGGASVPPPRAEQQVAEHGAEEDVGDDHACHDHGQEERLGGKVEVREV